MTIAIKDTSDPAVNLPDNCMTCDRSIATREEVGGIESVLGFQLPVCIHCMEGGAIRQVMNMVVDDAA